MSRSDYSDFLRRNVFSQTVEYALRAVVYIAQQAGPQTTEQVAAATQVPQAYLAKVLQGLRQAKIVRSQRGIRGGIWLAKPSADLTLLEVITAVDPIHRIRRCPLGLAAHGVVLCPLHRRLDNALASVEAALRDTTLADLLAERTAHTRSCPFPVTAKPTK
jgi:Rrf2 family protein